MEHTINLKSVLKIEIVYKNKGILHSNQLFTYRNLFKNWGTKK